MVLIESKSNPRAAYEFLAEIWLFDGSQQERTLRYNYQPVVNTQTSRQICKMISCRDEPPGSEVLQLNRVKSKSIDSKEKKAKVESREPNGVANKF